MLTGMMIHMKEETKKVSLDSLYKEMLFSSLPADIQRAMADKIEPLDVDATAKLADSRQGPRAFNNHQPSTRLSLPWRKWMRKFMMRRSMRFLDDSSCHSDREASLRHSAKEPVEDILQANPPMRRPLLLHRHPHHSQNPQESLH